MTTLVNRPTEVGPAASDLDVGLVDEPAVAGQPAAGTGSFDELRREPLDPPIDSYVIDADTALGGRVTDSVS